jgi:pyruvate/2-oxoglutarate dehydrogenase complex dihydrolipoamide acyltransferase (E2) component
MRIRATLKLGRVSANEDEAKVAEVHLRKGAPFHQGDLLLVLETTKTAVEVIAPANGHAIAVFAETDQMLQLGDEVFEAEFDGEPVFENLEAIHQNSPRN